MMTATAAGGAALVADIIMGGISCVAAFIGGVTTTWPLTPPFNFKLQIGPLSILAFSIYCDYPKL